jgi:acyl CoA:acetate/3-ketoacid CoA transferase alpha subunit
VTVAAVHRVVPLGSLDPEHVVTPGIFVQRVVQVERAFPIPQADAPRQGGAAA